ncbi:MAG: BspA family leucine-rich repeat surface protein [Prevotella sp.]|nr:BspA family leucine-rich repeat surface protein [Prevotella sp.]
MKQKVFLVFACLLMMVQTALAQTRTPQVIWCEGNGTLYLTNSETVYSADDTYNGQTVSKVWSGSDVTRNVSDTGAPAWRTLDYPSDYDPDYDPEPEDVVANNVTRVVIDESFKDVEVNSLFEYFYGLENITEIEGLGNLNPTNGANASLLFGKLPELTTIDLTGFDLSRLGNTNSMFYDCPVLKTIYCYQSLASDKVESANGMFQYCTSLKGGCGATLPSDYDWDDKACNINLANPFTGLFTMKNAPTGNGDDKPYQIETSEQWEALASYIYAGHELSGHNMQLVADIEVKTPMGTETNPYKGEFEGNKHTITAAIDQNWNTTGVASVPYTAPFAYINGATIQDLKVDGSIKGGIHTAGLVGSLDGDRNYITNCVVSADIVCDHREGSDPDYGGGIVGHAHSAEGAVEGCLFNGSLTPSTGEANSVAGAIVGWADDMTNIDIRACVENGTYGAFTRKGLDFYLGNNQILLKEGSGNYCLSDIEGPRAYTITTSQEELSLTFKDYWLNEFSMPNVTFYGHKNADGDIEGNGIVYNGVRYAKAGDVVSFEASIDIEYNYITSVSAYGQTLERASDKTYTTTMQAANCVVTAEWSDGLVPLAIWCEDVKALYFTFERPTFGDVYDGHSITKIWQGDAVKGSGEHDFRPGWVYDEVNATSATKVYIKNSFLEVQPASLASWFRGFASLTQIEGLVHLNNGKAIWTRGMFSGCSSLEALDLTGFDLSVMVTTDNVSANAEYMFQDCSKLAHIYCDQAFPNEVKAEGMFSGCTSLVSTNGTVFDSTLDYGESANNLKMANPFTGYFTPSEIQGTGTEADPYLISSDAVWKALAASVNSGADVSGKYFKQTADISVSEGIGTEASPFKGNYDGDGHTIHANILKNRSTTGVASVPFTAPFSYAEGINLKNIIVDGTVAGGIHTGGLVGALNKDEGASSYIENCRVSALVVCDGLDGDADHGGGFVGHARSSNVRLFGCYFDGKLQTSTATGERFGAAFVGWRDLTGYIYIKDCVENGTYEGFNHLALNFVYHSLNGGDAYDPDLGYNFCLNHEMSHSLAYPVRSGTEGLTLHFGEGTVRYSISGIQYFDFGDRGGIILNDPSLKGICFVVAHTNVSFTATVEEPQRILSVTAVGQTLTPDENGVYTVTTAAEDCVVEADVKTALWTEEGIRAESFSQIDKFKKTITITTPEELALLAYNVNSVSADNELSYEGWTITLGADLNMEDYRWDPIGNSLAQNHRFFGTFDGAGHTIKGLHNDDKTQSYVGLVGINNGTIKNVVLAESKLEGKRTVGAIAGYNRNVVENCLVKSTTYVTGTDYVGGVVASMYNQDKNGLMSETQAQLKGCVSEARVTGADFVGGLIGGLNSGKAEYSVYAGSSVARAEGSETSRIAAEVGNLLEAGEVYRLYYTDAALDALGNTTDTRAYKINVADGLVVDFPGDEIAYDVSQLTIRKLVYYGYLHAFAYDGNFFTTEGTNASFTIAPAHNSQLISSVLVDLGDGNGPVDIQVNQETGNTYDFTMPANDVTISAVFEDNPDFRMGDVNRDGSVTIADVTALVNIILGKATAADNYDTDAADVNRDNVITIADVTRLVNIILGKEGNTIVNDDTDDTGITYEGGGSGPALAKPLIGNDD